MSLARILRGSAQVVLTHVFYVGETVTDAAGPVTATLRRLDGTLVDTQEAGHAGGAGTPYTYVPPVQAQLDTLTVDWSGTVAGQAVVERDIVEVVGGFLFGLAEARNKKPVMDTNKFSTADLIAGRTEVEIECERICGTSWVPRFKRVAVDVDGCRDRLLAPHTQLRTLRAVTVNGVAWTVDQVAAVVVSDTGVLTLPAGHVWPTGGRGRSRVVLEYEHGYDLPPDDVRTAGIIRLRSRLGLFDTGVPYRAISFTAAEGGTYRLSTPGPDRTGMPEVDAAYLGNRVEVGGFA